MKITVTQYKIDYSVETKSEDATLEEMLNWFGGLLKTMGYSDKQVDYYIHGDEEEQTDD